MGDHGFFENDNFKFEVMNTTKIFGNYFLHKGKVISGECEIEDTIKASINTLNRDFIKYNHSSTHLITCCSKKNTGQACHAEGLTCKFRKT